MLKLIEYLCYTFFAVLILYYLMLIFRTRMVSKYRDKVRSRTNMDYLDMPDFHEMCNKWWIPLKDKYWLKNK